MLPINFMASELLYESATSLGSDKNKNDPQKHQHETYQHISRTQHQQQKTTARNHADKSNQLSQQPNPKPINVKITSEAEFQFHARDNEYSHFLVIFLSGSCCKNIWHDYSPVLFFLFCSYCYASCFILFLFCYSDFIIIVQYSNTFC